MYLSLIEMIYMCTFCTLLQLKFNVKQYLTIWFFNGSFEEIHCGLSGSKQFFRSVQDAEVKNVWALCELQFFSKAVHFGSIINTNFFPTKSKIIFAFVQCHVLSISLFFC